MKRGGLVLAGGSSKRMGTDKAALRIGGVTLLERTIATLLRACNSDGTAPEVVVVGGSVTSFGDSLVTWVADAFPNEGPLGGIVSGLRRLAELHEQANVAVISCDLPYLRASSIDDLFMAIENDSRFDGAVSLFEGRRQPLHAVYRIEALDVFIASFDAGNRRVERALDGIRIVGIDDPFGSSSDVDTPEDWIRITRSEATEITNGEHLRKV